MRNPIRIFVSTLGAILSLAGIEHGVGEILQGNIAPAGLVFPSWPDAAFFRNLGGEPAMSLIPNLLVTGVLAVLFSLALLVWSVWFVDRRYGGPGMILLSAILLPLGGGIFPPVLGVLTGVLAMRIHAPHRWWRAHLSAGVRRFLIMAWPWSYTACILSWLMLMPGVGLLGYFFGVDSVPLILAIGCCVLVSLLAAIITSFAAAADQHA